MMSKVRMLQMIILWMEGMSVKVSTIKRPRKLLPSLRLRIPTRNLVKILERLLRNSGKVFLTCGTYT